MIPRDFIDQLLARIDIVEIIDRRVSLRKAGQNYQACCPFHQEKTPSFTVSPQKQFYHCFGCGAHGSAIGFLIEYEGLSFVDAVHTLAETAGMTVPETRETTPRPRPDPNLTEHLDQAARFYRAQLKRSEPAIQYLKNRGLNGQTAARYGLGYAPAQRDALRAAFPQYDSPQLVSAGLVIDGDYGRHDRFRERIMFPIRNRSGQIIGFGGRILGSGEPKYLNSPETPVFTKGNEVYGLFEARQSLRERNHVLVVEGYMDVVMLAQHDITYAVATLGTATTPVQARLLLRQADRVSYCFDGDNAGRKAAWRALENTLEALTDNKRVAFLFLPEGEDPDSHVRRHGRVAFETLLDREALPLSEYLVSELCRDGELAALETRARILQTARPLLARMQTAPLLASLIRRELAQRLRLDETLLAQPSDNTRARRPAARTATRRERPGYALYRRIASLLLLYPQRASEVPVARLLPDQTWSRELQDWLHWLQLHPATVGTPPAALLESLRGNPLENAIAALLADMLSHDESFDPDAEFSGALRQINSMWRTRRRQELASRQVLNASEKAELLALLSDTQT
jgi:DNA primase